MATNQTSEPSIYGIIRSIFQVAGAYLIGHSLFGFSITSEWWQTALGVALSAASFVWSIKSKIATIEMTQGFIRELMTFVFAFLGSIGLVTDEQAIGYIGLVSAFIPTIYAYFSRKKTEMLDTGKLTIPQLKQ